MADFRDFVQLESAGALTAAAGKDRVVLPFNGEFVSASVVVSAAPGTGAIIVDLMLNGTTIYTTTANRPTVDIAAVASSAANRVLRPDVTEFVAGDVLSLDIIQVGTTPAGSDLEVSVQYIAV